MKNPKTNDSWKRNVINGLFVLLLLSSCSAKRDQTNYSHRIEKPKSSDSVEVQDIPAKHEIEGTLFHLRFELENNNPQVSYLKTLIKDKNINREFKTGRSEEIEYFTTYLGQTTLNDTENHVFKQFYPVQAAISKHGNSVLVFINKNRNSVYDMEMPENLPLDMKNGSFRYVHKKDTLKLKAELVEDYLTFRSMRKMY